MSPEIKIVKGDEVSYWPGAGEFGTGVILIGEEHLGSEELPKRIAHEIYHTKHHRGGETWREYLLEELEAELWSSKVTGSPLGRWNFLYLWVKNRRKPKREKLSSREFGQLLQQAANNTGYEGILPKVRRQGIGW